MSKPYHPKAKEMAHELVDLHFRKGLDLGDYVQIHKALFAKDYTQDDIEKHSDDASYLARRAIQGEQKIDNVACIALMPVIGALAALAWIAAPEPAQAASILTPSACAAGGDIAMALFGAAVAGSAVAILAWWSAGKIRQQTRDEESSFYPHRKQ